MRKRLMVVFMAALMATSCGDSGRDPDPMLAGPEWGPMALAHPPYTAMTGGEGVLRIDAPCVTLGFEGGLSSVSLIWRSDRARWDADEPGIRVDGFLLRDGDLLQFGANGEDQLSDWARPPHESCPEPWILVLEVESVGASAEPG